MKPLQALPLRRTMVAGDVEIHHAESGTGRALVFVHGGFGDWRSWAPQWAAFVPHYRCITYSRRYSVPNDNALRGGEHSVRVEADDLGELLDAWRAAPAVIVGTSYGAYTALALALESPHKVCALVLTEPPVMRWADRVPGGRAARESFEREVLTPAAHAFERGEVDTAVRLLTDGINGTAPSSANTPEGLATRRENLRAMQALLSGGDPFPALDETRLRRLDKPTLLVAGARTQPIHDAIYKAACSVMPHAEHERLPDCGHGAHRDNPAAFNAAVLAFLRRQRL